MNLKQIVKGKSSPQTALGQMVKRFNDDVVAGQLLPQNIGSVIFSEEGFSDSTAEMVSTSIEELTSTFEAIAAEADFSVEAYQLESGKMGALLGTNPTAFIEQGIPSITTSGKNTSVAKTFSVEGFEERHPSFEAFDESATAKVAKTYGFFYNAAAPQQSELGELFYPTVPVSPDEAGFAIQVKALRVGRSVEHSTSGAVTKFRWINALRTSEDPSLIRNDLTRLVPVYRSGVNADKFVTDANYAGSTVPMTDNVGGTDIPTMPLKVGTEVSLLGISQTDSLLSKGVMDESDTIDPSMTVGKIMFGVDNDAGDAHAGFLYEVSGLPTSNWTHTTQGSDQDLQLDFDSTAVIISADTKDMDGNTIGTVSGIPAGYKYRLRVEMSGRANIQEGNAVVYGNAVQLVSVMDDTGATITDPTDAKFTDAKAIVDRIKILGWMPDAYRRNCNKRTLDTYIDSTTLTELYHLRYRSSISRNYCPGGMTDGDPKDLADLINFTRLATKGSAVEELFSAVNTLKAFHNVVDENGDSPEVLGMGRLLVRPTFMTKDIDVSQEVDPSNSSTRGSDIAAVLIGYMRDFAARMVLESNYKTAREFSGVGNAGKVTIIVATDPVIHRYLTVDGEVRTLGEGLDLKIVSDNNVKLRGRIVMGIGVFDNKRNSEPNPLNHGNMGWAPEITAVLNTSTGGANRRVLSVTPRYLHVTHLPVMATLEVSGLPESLGKLAQLRHNV